MLCVVQDSVCCSQFAGIAGISIGVHRQDAAVEDLRLDAASLTRYTNVRKGDVQAQQPGYMVFVDMVSTGERSDFAPWGWPKRSIYAFLFRLTPF